MALRVIQWATGTTGKHSLRAVIDTPGLELAGVYTYDPAKAGCDAGELCGKARTGVTATRDRDAILAMDADCVLYMAKGEGMREQVMDDVCALLASGKNVVSIAMTELIYPKACGPAVVEQLEAACRQGNTSFHATGIEPGWASEVLPLAMSGLFRRIDRLVVQEIMDYSSYISPSTMAAMGFGVPPRDVAPMPVPLGEGGSFMAPIMMVADALGATVEAVEFEQQSAAAPCARDAGGIHIEAGMTAGKRYGFSATIAGRKAITVEHITRLGDDVAPDWPQGRGWYVTIEGSPSMVLRCEIALDGSDENDRACLATAMHAVHAVAPVCAADPGIRTFLDLPVIMGVGAFGRSAG